MSFSKQFYVDVNRTWIDRLFSWPWRPWVKTKRVERFQQVKEIPSNSEKTIKFRRYESLPDQSLDCEIQHDWRLNGE